MTQIKWKQNINAYEIKYQIFLIFIENIFKDLGFSNNHLYFGKSILV